MVNLDDVPEGIKELERAAKMGLAGAMISVYPLAGQQYDQPEYSDFLGRSPGPRYASHVPFLHPTP